MNLLILLATMCLFLGEGIASTCPCSKELLCEPLTVKYDQEILAFSTNGKKNFRVYDWDKLTTVVVFGDWSDDLLCEAHEKVCDSLPGKYLSKANNKDRRMASIDIVLLSLLLYEHVMNINLIILLLTLYVRPFLVFLCRSLFILKRKIH